MDVSMEKSSKEVFQLAMELITRALKDPQLARSQLGPPTVCAKECFGAVTWPVPTR